jgi:hypothetical protein
MTTMRARFLRPLALALLATAAPVLAGGGPGSGQNPFGPSGNTNASSPGDEVTSLPIVSAPSGLTFIGTPRELRALVLDVTGRGQVHVLRLGSGQIAATLEGDYVVTLDRAVLASSRVQTLFQAGRRFSAGRAQLELWGGFESYFPAETFALPLPRLAAAPALQGAGLELEVLSPRLELYRAGARFGRSEVTLVQVERGFLR